MAENRDNNPLLSWPGMLGLTALVSSLFWLISPLRSSRPSDKPVHERTSIGDQDIEARLWQDPVGAILERRKEFKDDSTTNDVQTRSEKDTRFSVGEIARQIERRFTFLADENRVPTNILILQVMIPGGPYVEDSGSRRRGRYSVVSALSVGGYVPWDADHIGYFNVPWLRGAELQRTANSTIPALSECIDSQPSITVPFERCQPNELQPPAPKNV